MFIQGICQALIPQAPTAKTAERLFLSETVMNFCNTIWIAEIVFFAAQNATEDLKNKFAVKKKFFFVFCMNIDKKRLKHEYLKKNFYKSNLSKANR